VPLHAPRGSRSAPGADATGDRLARWARTNAQVAEVLRRSGEPVISVLRLPRCGWPWLGRAALRNASAGLARARHEPTMLQPAFLTSLRRESHPLERRNRMRSSILPPKVTECAFRSDGKGSAAVIPGSGSRQLPPLQADETPTV